MSLLSSPQGRPYTVRTFIETLKNLGGSMPAAESTQWFLPGPFHANDNSDTRIKEAIGCAVSLGWVRSERGGNYELIDLEIPSDLECFFDHLHRTLCATKKPEDQRILEAYAFVVVQMDIEGSSDWLKQCTVKQLAERVDKALLGGDPTATSVFNPTKVAPWRVWLEAIGLGWESQTLKHLLPDPVPRMIRELPGLIEQFGVEREIPPYEFLRALAARMPYLDGGAIFRDISQRMQHPPSEGRATRVLARTLFELEDDGRLTLVKRDDAAAQALLLPRIDGWMQRLVVGVVLHEEAQP